MSDFMLHGVLNMPLPDDPSEMGAVEWLQFRERARQASQRIEADADRIEELEAKLAKAVEVIDEAHTSMLNHCDAEAYRILDAALSKLEGESDGLPVL